jgi:hypothetical protein
MPLLYLFIPFSSFLPLFLARYLDARFSRFLLLAIAAAYAFAMAAVSVLILKKGIADGKRVDFLVYNGLGLLFTLSLSAYFPLG